MSVSQLSPLSLPLVSLLKDLKHANIVTLHDIIHTEKSLTLVFEYLVRPTKLLTSRPACLTLFCAQMLKQIHLHNYYSWPSASFRTKAQEHNSSSVAVGVLVAFLLVWRSRFLSRSLSVSRLGQRPQAVHGRLREHPEHAECQGESLQAACWPGQLHQHPWLCGCWCQRKKCC